jgi:cytochrome c5
MKKQIVAVLAAAFFAAVCVPVIFSAEEKAAQKEDIASVVKTKCVVCHDIKRTCSEIGEADAKEWKKIVDRMKERGAKVDEAEAAKVTEYLSGLKDAKVLCP